MKLFVFLALVLISCGNGKEIESTKAEINKDLGNLFVATNSIKYGAMWGQQNVIEASRKDSFYYQRKLDSLLRRLRELGYSGQVEESQELKNLKFEEGLKLDKRKRQDSIDNSVKKYTDSVIKLDK